MVIIIIYYICSSGKVRVAKKDLYPLVGFIPFYLYAIVLSVIHCIISDNNKSAYLFNATHIVLSAVFILVSICFFLTVVRYGRIDIEDIEKMVIFSGVVQFVLTAFSMISTELHSMFIQMVIRFSHNEQTVANITKLSFRAYGFSGYFFDIMGYIIAIISAIAFLKGKEEKKNIYIFFAILFQLVSIVNARTGVVISVFSFIVIWFFYRDRNGKVSLKRVMLPLLCVIVVVAVYLFLPQWNKSWLESIITALRGLLSGSTEKGVFSQILGADIVFPDNLLFGIGARPESMMYFASDGSYIDSGYIQIVWRFGLIGFILLMVGFFIFFRTISKKTQSKKMICICITFCFIILLYLFKGYPITYHGANILLLAFPIIYYNENKYECKLIESDT